MDILMIEISQHAEGSTEGQFSGQSLSTDVIGHRDHPQTFDTQRAFQRTSRKFLQGIEDEYVLALFLMLCVRYL